MHNSILGCCTRDDRLAGMMGKHRAGGIYPWQTMVQGFAAVMSSAIISVPKFQQRVGLQSAYAL